MLHKFLQPLLLLLLSFLYFSDLGAIPFHPDETTFLFTSRDFETFFSDPLSMAWVPNQEMDALARYRLLDEPFSRYVFGLARWLAGIPPSEVAVDWDWSLSWEENKSRGALPASRTLLVGRAASTALVLAAGFLLSGLVRKIGGQRAAVLALLLFSLNSLTLLHGRRSMREGVLLFGAVVLLRSLENAGRRPWAAGLAAGLALSARYLTAPLVLISLVAAIWEPLRGRQWSRAGANALQFTVCTLGLFYFLQPVLWKHPLQGLGQIVSARATFTREGIDLLQQVAPEAIPDGATGRAALLLVHSFPGPMQYYEVGNYASELAPQIAAYEALPYSQLSRGMVWGGLNMFFVLAGGVLTGYRVWKTPGSPLRLPFLLGLATVLELAFLLAAIPLPIQRYAMALVPLFSVWGGLAIARSNQNNPGTAARINPEGSQSAAT